jgi:integrase
MVSLPLSPGMASIWKNPKSKYWTACWRDPSGKQRRATTRTTDRRLARRMAEEFERATKSKQSLAQFEKVLRGLHEQFGSTDFEKRSLHAFLKEWVAEKEPSVAPSTIKFYRATVQKLLEYFGERANQPIAEVTPGDLVGFRNQLAQQTGASTVNHDLVGIKMIFKAARRLGRITEDPAEFVAPVREFDDPSEEKRRPFTIAELQALLATADDEWQSMIKLGLYSGARLGDIALLRWSNVDLERGELRFTARKTGKSTLLPIVGPMLSHLETLASSEDPHGFLHPRAAGVLNRTNQSAGLSRLFGELLEQAGLRPVKSDNSLPRRRGNSLSFHSLRHTMVSLLKDAGVAQAVVQELAGHASVEMSARYTHTDRQSMERAIAALPRL